MDINSIIKSENNIYFLLAVTIIIILLRNSIPVNIIEFFQTDIYNIIMLLLISFTGKTNLSLGIIFLQFYYFSCQLQKIRVDNGNGNGNVSNNNSNEYFDNQNELVEPFVISKEYFKTADRKSKKNKSESDSYMIYNTIENYASGVLNNHSELFTPATL